MLSRIDRTICDAALDLAWYDSSSDGGGAWVAAGSDDDDDDESILLLDLRETRKHQAQNREHGANHDFPGAGLLLLVRQPPLPLAYDRVGKSLLLAQLPNKGKNCSPSREFRVRTFRALGSVRLSHFPLPLNPFPSPLHLFPLSVVRNPVSQASAMRIRKRTSSQSVVAVPATVTPQPISCKYQTMTCSQIPRERRFPECSNMQENRCLNDHEASTRPDPVNVSNEHVKDEARRPHASPTKRRKIEHDSTLNLDFKGSDAMTAAELLAVAELANGVRQRLAASEQSTSREQDEISEPAEEDKNNLAVAAVVSDPNSKDALISSIFYVFDTHGDHGLSASEVVKHMIEQGLPGLKEGGARHTVQVANVLRSSSSFFSLGDKKYMLCSNVYGEPTAAKASSKGRSHKPTTIQKADDSLENVNEPVVAKPSTRKKVQQPVKEVSTPEGVDAVRVARRRGPSSAQKGKGPTQCKRYDGRGWQCSRLTEPGYSLCSHHQDLINKRAAKLKDQQTLSRLMESVQRKAKQQPSAVPSSTPPSTTTTTTTTTTTPTDDVAAPLQKRKMLSLLAINK